MRAVLKLSWWLSILLFRLSFSTARLATVAVAALLLHLLSRPRNSHGSAKWAAWYDLILGNAWSGNRGGIVVGKIWGRFIRFARDGAMLVYAPMGAGKGVGLVIPNLLEYPGAIVCTDPKEENYAITRRWRSTLGPVHCLNAIDPRHSNHWNPFDIIRLGTPHEADDCAIVADFLVMPANSHDSHWDRSTRALLASIIQHVAHTRPPAERTLATVRELVASDESTFAELMHDMTQSPSASVAEAGRDVLGSLGSEEMASIKKNAALATVIWSKDRIAGQLTATSDFDIMDLHRQTITVYVMVPEDALTVYAPFLRVMMGCAIVALVRGKDVPRPKYKPLLLLDECAALGRLEALEKGLGYLREYARPMLIFQDLGQLKRQYGEFGARTFMAAAACQVAFGVSDVETAREVAESIGLTTVMSRSEGASQTNTDLLRRLHQEGSAETARYLVDPAEIRWRLNDRAIIFMRGQVRAPILANKVRYFRESRWKGRYDAWRVPAPTATGGAVPQPDGCAAPSIASVEPKAA
jgi:type IV secretion system protein VirD4